VLGLSLADIAASVPIKLILASGANIDMGMVEKGPILNRALHGFLADIANNVFHSNPLDSLQWQ
jgi:polyribonucleotide nucleotidyltransferase